MKIMEMYLETSIINGCFSRDTHIKAVSELFFEEVRKGNIVAHTSTCAFAEIIKTSDGTERGELFSILGLMQNGRFQREAVEDLGREYVKYGAIPAEYEMEAFHMVVANLGGYEALVTCDREHIKKLKTIRKEEV